MNHFSKRLITIVSTKLLEQISASRGRVVHPFIHLGKVVWEPCVYKAPSWDLNAEADSQGNWCYQTDVTTAVNSQLNVGMTLQGNNVHPVSAFMGKVAFKFK